jgi:pimeloyl-ACP methyl ester carboxylesterase
LFADTRAGVALAAEAFARITDTVREFHGAVSGIPFRSLAPLPLAGTGSAAVQVLHEGIAGGVYAAVRGIGGASFALADAALKIAERHTRTSDARLRVVRDNVAGAINGLVGDYTTASRNSLAIRAGFYQEGELLSLTRPALAAAWPRASSRLVIFVHGLCCNEYAWRMRGLAGDERESTPYGAQLAAETGCTPLYFRYNTGLPVARNGRLLARAMAQLVANWPVAVDDIALIGHSMGGLVCRAAAHTGFGADASWTTKVSNVVCLGSPHLGAPLEKAVHLGVAVMGAFDLTRPWTRMLEVRSAGIRDLRLGTLGDRHDRVDRSQVRTIPNARYHFIGASIGRDVHDLRGQVFGDGLVRLSSATARELADADTAVLFGLHHMQLLNHPAVYRELRARLAAAASMDDRKRGRVHRKPLQRTEHLEGV